MKEQLVSFIENSFLKDLLVKKGITDVSYNGISLFYVLNKTGRQKSNIKVTSNEVLDFLRQIANFSEKQFSYANPILDVSVGRYRMNAVHTSIVRVGDEKACSFSLRIGSTKCLIENDRYFIPEEAEKYLLDSLSSEKSLVIAGPTGSGKTELQKYLLSKLKKYSRVIVIDNIQELENLRIYKDLDLTSWQISQFNEVASMQELIKNALRSNPDWLVIAESRGKEMNEILNSVMTGHPVITTLHAESLSIIPNRIARMVEMDNVNQKHEDVMSDVISGFKRYVFLNRDFSHDGKVKRYVESIGEMQEDGKMKIIYRRSEHEKD